MKKPLHPDDRSFIALKGSLSAMVLIADFSHTHNAPTKVLFENILATYLQVIPGLLAFVNEIILKTARWVLIA
jgi:hypothetical protein